MALPKIKSLDLDAVRGVSAPRVVFPWSANRVRWEALDALYRQWPGVLPVQLDADDGAAYGHLLRMLFSLRETLVIVEHDVVVPNASIRRLLRCKQEWCTHAQPYGGKLLTDSLGLVKFEGSLLERWPDVTEYAFYPLGRHKPIKTWATLDMAIAHRLRLHGLEPHVHPGDIRHLHEFDHGAEG